MGTCEAVESYGFVGSRLLRPPLDPPLRLRGLRSGGLLACRQDGRWSRDRGCSARNRRGRWRDQQSGGRIAATILLPLITLRTVLAPAGNTVLVQPLVSDLRTRPGPL